MIHVRKASSALLVPKRSAPTTDSVMAEALSTLSDSSVLMERTVSRLILRWAMVSMEQKTAPPAQLESSAPLEESLENAHLVMFALQRPISTLPTLPTTRTTRKMPIHAHSVTIVKRVHRLRSCVRLERSRLRKEE